MSTIQVLAMQPGVERLGLTLVHFLWEGTILAAIYASARQWGAGRSGPNRRYFMACAALTAMAIAPLATWMLLGAPTPETAAVSFAAPMSTVRTEAARINPLALSGEASGAAPGLFFSWVVALWMTGATAFSLRLAAGWILAVRVRSARVRPAPAEWQRSFDRLKIRISVSRPVHLLVSGLLEAPAAIGWLRPMVLVPAGALTGLPAAQVEALLLHELAHIRRHDYLVNILQSAVEAVFFYHPAVWWISGHMRAERELCCDDMAVGIAGDAVLYVRALAELDSARWARPAVMSANGGSLAERIARLLGRPSASERGFRGSGTAPALILLAIGGWAVFAQPAARPQFEAASVKPSFDESIQHVRPLPGRLTADASLQILMQYAYGVQAFQLTGGPGWLRSERYQIDAKADGNVSRDRMFLMLRSLLENRFQLKTHHETRELPVYVLAAARGGLKLPPPREGVCVDSAADAATEWVGGRMAVPGGVPHPKGLCGSASVHLEATGPRVQGGRIAMPELVRMLSLVLGRNVIDRTRFTELFDVQLDFVADESTPVLPPPPPGVEMPGPTITQALRQQLGLQLESAKGPVDVIVVDHAERPAVN